MPRTSSCRSIPRRRCRPGAGTEHDRVARLRLFADTYGSPVTPAELVDLAAMRLLSIGAHIEARIRAEDPAFAVHRAEDHGSGYRAAASYILTHRAELLGLTSTPLATATPTRITAGMQAMKGAAFNVQSGRLADRT
jgi:hypothetical protein